MNIKSRISKLETSVKPNCQREELDLSILTNEELNRLEYLIDKSETGITQKEYREINELCDKCKKNK